jgi:hypothetical protein
MEPGGIEPPEHVRKPREKCGFMKRAQRQAQRALRRAVLAAEALCFVWVARVGAACLPTADRFPAKSEAASILF